MQATIQAVDTDEGTWYVLTREGHEPVVAAWPQPLEALAPNAVRLPAYRSIDDDLGNAVTVAVGCERQGRRTRL